MYNCSSPLERCICCIRESLRFFHTDQHVSSKLGPYPGLLGGPIIADVLVAVNV